MPGTSVCQTDDAPNLFFAKSVRATFSRVTLAESIRIVGGGFSSEAILQGPGASHATK
jgi:hypothetical protein